MSIILFILFILFLFLLIVLSFGLSIIKGVLRLFFGSPNSSQKRQANSSSEEGNESSHQKKVFEKDEGEYVDYEDIE